MLALLDELKSAVRDFVAREEKLHSDFRIQSAAELKAFSSRNEAQEAAADAQEKNLASARETKKRNLHFRFEKRKARINRVYAAVSKRMLNELSERDAGWRNRTQQGVQAAELHRDEELADAAAARENFQQQLSAAGDGL